MVDDQRPAGPRGRLDDGGGILDADGQRLLAENVPARLQRSHGDRSVPVGRRGDDHRVDLAIGADPRGVGEHPTAVPRGESLGPAGLDVGDRGDAHGREVGDGAGDEGREAAGPDEAQPQRLGGHGAAVTDGSR